jgi:hypothetical protein
MAKGSAPQTIEEYIEWAKSIGIDFSPPSQKRYEINVQGAQNAVQNSAFVQAFPSFLEAQQHEYRKETGGQLLLAGDLRVVGKPFDSAVTKSFRHNVLRNKKFPDPPAAGWIDPNNWYSRFDDLVRSTLVCKFLDGPRALAEALIKYATSLGVSGRYIPRNTDDGYYAFHQYTAFDIEVLDQSWNAQTVRMEFEIQLTTQLQEILRELTHPLYERARVSTERRDDAWKWDHDSPRFRTSYLGHTLHMIEAVILQVRDSANDDVVTLPTALQISQLASVAPARPEVQAPMQDPEDSVAHTKPAERVAEAEPISQSQRATEGPGVQQEVPAQEQPGEVLNKPENPQ